MTAIPALSRLRRASDDEILAERLEPPYTPLRWPGGALEPPTDVYAEVIDTDANVYTTPIYTTPDPALYRLQPGLIPPDVDFTRASLATYHDESGALQTAASHVLRDDHWIGGERTILLEGMRTNWIPESRLTESWWTKFSDVSEVADTALGRSVYKLRYTGDHRAAYRNSFIHGSTVGIPRTISILARAGTVRMLRLTSARAGGQAGTVDVDLLTGSHVGSGSSYLHSRADPVGGGWWLVQVTYTPMSADNYGHHGFSIRFGDTAGLDPEGDDHLFVAGPQIEDDVEYASSRIFAAGVEVTRAADSLTCDLPAGGLYERWLDPITGAVTDTLTPQAGGEYVVPTGRAYTHLLVVRSGLTIADARRIAGVTP